MASRFYVEASGAAAISPAVDSIWDLTANGFVRVPASLDTPATTTLANIGDTADTDNANKQLVITQAICGPYPPQTYDDQTVKYSFQASETSSLQNLFLALVVRFLAEDDEAELGQMVFDGSGMMVDDVELSIGMLSRFQSASSGTAQVINESHYIVFELGVTGDPVTGGHQSLLRMGTDASAGDLPESDNNSSATRRGWIEFANTIVSEGFAGPMEADLQEATFAGTGAQTQTSTLDADLTKATFAGTNANIITGTEAAAAQKATFSGIGVVGSFFATMAATMQEATAEMEGEIEGAQPAQPFIDLTARYAPIVR